MPDRTSGTESDRSTADPGRTLRRVLVTGASGFVGRVLCRRLAAEGVGIVGLARDPAEGAWGRLLLVDLERDRVPTESLMGLDTAIHLAARVHHAADGAEVEDRYRAANVEGTRRVLAACAAAGIGRLVFASSVKAMGESTAGCADETTALAPATPYGRSKQAAEALLASSPGPPDGPDTVVLRLPAVYGPGVDGNLATMLRAVQRGRFPPPPELGNRRSLVHVEDVAAAAILCARRREAAGRVYLVTDGAVHSTRTIYEAMCRAAGLAVPRWSVPAALLRASARVGDGLGRVLGRTVRYDSTALEKLTGDAWYGCARIRAELGFEPAHDLAGGLAEMVAALGEESG